MSSAAARQSGALIQGLIALGETQAQQRHRRRLLVEHRQRNGRHPRARQQLLGKLDVGSIAQCAIIDQLEERALGRWQRQAAVRESRDQPVALGAEEAAQCIAAVRPLAEVAAIATCSGVAMVKVLN
jgi:hypothetical protein